MSRSYVPRDGEMLVKPPVDITVSMHSFVAAASWAPLKRLCDEQLNLGGTTTYVPLGPFVVFYCAEMDNIVKQGSIEERDFGVWVPVVACERAGGIPVPRRFLTFTPYVWVSNSPALVGGRTVFGFPKHLGDLGVPPQAGAPGAFTVDTWVVGREGDPAEKLRLLEIATAAEHERAPVWRSTLDAVIGHAEDLASRLVAEGPLSKWEDVVDLFTAGAGMPMVFLKQFLAADGTADACYQAILEAVIRVTGDVAGGPIPQPWDITLLECFSHDIVNRLGLSGVTRTTKDGRTYATLQSLATAWMKFRARVEAGNIIWEAS